MTHPETIKQDIEGPKGVYFFAQDSLVQQFLAREGDPDEILNELAQRTIEDMTQVCHFLKTSFLQCRGVEKISEEETEEAENAAIAENEIRMQFYMAAHNKLAQLVLGEQEAA